MATNAPVFDCFVKRDDKEVVVIFVRLTNASDLGHYYEHDFGDTQIARLVCDTIRSAMSDRVKSLVERAYHQGWEDHRKRQRKKDCFTSCLHTIGDVAW